MLGRVLNTHQQWLCRELSDMGYSVTRQVAVADTAETIRQTVREALARVPLAIVTGGLGPTSDDLTRDAIAALFGRTLYEDAEVLRQIGTWFQGRKRPMPVSTKVQAMVPEGARVLHNAFGTAPGLVIEANPNPFNTACGSTAALVMLPGPPRELRPMFKDKLVPWLREAFPLREDYRCVNLRTTGIGESMVQELIAPSLEGLVAKGLDVGYCARPGEVDVRLSARSANAGSIVDEACDIVRHLVSRWLFAEGDDPIEATLVKRLIETGRTLVAAESCTGGRLSSRITDVPGASAVFLGGLVTYSNALKESVLGVAPATLAAHGAVSEETAREMAEGARQRYGADYAIAITGIAGPGGGTEAKPVGTVFIALASPEGTEVVKNLNRWERETFKQATAQQAMDMLLRKLASKEQSQ